MFNFFNELVDYCGFDVKDVGSFNIVNMSNKIIYVEGIKNVMSISSTLIVVKVKGKERSQNTRQGRTVGKTSDYTKAIVTLKQDSKPIAFFESLS